MKKVLLFVVICSGVLCLSFSKAHAEGKLTVDEMKAVSGQATLVGQICEATRGACREGSGLSDSYDCQRKMPLNYSECVLDPNKDVPSGVIRTCSQVTVDTCEITHWLPTYPDGSDAPAGFVSCSSSAYGIQKNSIKQLNRTDPNGC